MEITLQSIVLRFHAAWLRRRVVSYARMLSAIADQRKNDFEAERWLHRRMACAHAELQLLDLAPRTGSHKKISLRQEKFRPRIFKLVQKD
jgi:hypothetical protein